MMHYVCPGCQNVSEYPDQCQTGECARKGEELKACTCDDLAHKEVVEPED